VSPAHDFAEPVRQVIEALTGLMASTSQKERAAALGHRAHSEVSRIEQRVVTGEADNYLDAYGPARVVLFARAFPEFREALISATAPTTAAAEPERCGTDLVDVASTCARSIETIVQRLPDGLSVTELREIDEQLHTLQETLRRTRVDIGRKIRGPRLSEAS
jgi:hypothetical protein